MMSFRPLKNTLEVAPKLRAWLDSWLPKVSKCLEPIDWFGRRHDLLGGSNDQRGFWRNIVKLGCMIWTPAPAAAQIALEQLQNTRLKSQESMYVVIIPNLMTLSGRNNYSKYLT